MRCRGVGENLQDHLQIRAVYGVEGAKTLNTMAASLWGKAMIGLHYALKRSGPMSMAPSQLGAFTQEPARPRPRQSRVPRAAALARRLRRAAARLQRIHGERLQPEPDQPRQRPHRVGRHRPTPPRIAPDYLATDADRRVAAQSLRVTRRIVAQPALARFKPRELKPGPQFESDADLAKLAGDIGTTIFHPVGTAKMGPAADPMAVVDARLRVHGLEGPARRRRQRHADHHQRQHHRADPDDRRARRRMDPAAAPERAAAAYSFPVVQSEARSR